MDGWNKRYGLICFVWIWKALLSDLHLVSHVFSSDMHHNFAYTCIHNCTYVYIHTHTIHTCDKTVYSYTSEFVCVWIWFVYICIYIYTYVGFIQSSACTQQVLLSIHQAMFNVQNNVYKTKLMLKKNFDFTNQTILNNKTELDGV